MLTDEQIEQVLYEYTNRQEEFNLSVIRVIAERLTRIAAFDSLFTLNTQSVMREDVLEMKKLHKRYIKKQLSHLEDDFWDIAVFLYAEAKGFYDTQVVLQQNEELKSVIDEMVVEARKSLAEILQNPVFVIRDLKNPAVLKAQTFEETYNSIINEAYNYRSLNDSLRSIALKRTETQLFASGVRYAIDNSSDNARNVTSANSIVRFNVLDSVKNFINRFQKVMGKQFKANGLELSAHIFPAPDHAPAQGHQFTFENVDKMQSGEDFEDVDGNSYVGFERNIGQWNCRHYFMQIKLGAEPQYSQRQLDKILEDNARGYTDETGRHRTLYECTQVQRRYERAIRNAKQKYLYGKMLNDRAMMFSARNRVGKLTTKYKQFSNACGIPAKMERIKVKDY